MTEDARIKLWRSGMVGAVVFGMVLALPRLFAGFFPPSSDFTSILLAISSDFFLIFALLSFEKNSPRIGAFLGFIFCLLLSIDWLVWFYARRHLSDLPAAVSGAYELLYVLKMSEYQIGLFLAFVSAVFIKAFVWRTTRFLVKPSRSLWAIFICFVSAISFSKISSYLSLGVSRAVPMAEALNILPNGMRLFDVVDFSPALKGGAKNTTSIVLTQDELNELEALGLPVSRGTLQHLVSANTTGANNKSMHLSQMPPKIILITIESLARSLIRRFNKTNEKFSLPEWVTPNLDRLAETAVSFDRHGTTMMPTLPGLYATLLSLPVQLDEGRYRHNPLPAILKRAGYKTVYLQGAHLKFSRMDQIIKKTFEYDAAYGLQEIRKLMNGGGDSWGWGLRDRTVYNAAEKIMTANQDEKQFIHILTLDTHPPWPTVEDLPDAPPELAKSDRMLQALYAADRALGNFIENIKRQGWLDRGALIIITADHSPNHFYSEYMPENRALAPDLIPLFIVHRELDKTKISSDITGKMSSQVDVAPTLLALLGLEIPSDYFGRNLFDPDTKPLWLRRTIADKHGHSFEVHSSAEVMNASIKNSDKNTLAGAQSKSAILNRWVQQKIQSKLVPTNLNRIEAFFAEKKAAIDGTMKQTSNRFLIFSTADGIKLYSKWGEDFGFVVDRLWSGAEIINSVGPKSGVALPADRSLILSVEPGVKKIGGTCGVTAIPAVHVGVPKEFECRISLYGKTLKSILFPPGNLGFEKFVLGLPYGVTNVLFEFLSIDPQNPTSAYGQGFLGDLHVR